MDTCTCATTRFAVPTHGDAYLVTAGVIDDQAVTAFTEGQCHALAFALHEATGWPIVALVQPTEWSCVSDMDKWIDKETHVMARSGLRDFGSHLLVRRPDGALVDIRGAHTIVEVFDSYAVETPYPDPTWGLMPDDPEDVECLLEEWDGRLVAVDPASINWLWDRRTAVEAARTLVAPVLALLEDTPSAA